LYVKGILAIFFQQPFQPGDKKPASVHFFRQLTVYLEDSAKNLIVNHPAVGAAE
jgi:hypothetical protein